MNYSRRYLTVRDETSSVAFTAVLTNAQGKTTLKTERGSTFIDDLVVSDGKTFEKYAFNEVIALDTASSDELYLLYSGDGKYYFAKLGERFFDAEKFICEYKKTAEKKDDGTAQAHADLLDYDDEKIAEENYYLKAENGKTENLQDARSEAEEVTIGKVGESRGVSCADDGGSGAYEKPTHEFRREDLLKSDRKTLYERCQKEKRKSDLIKLIVENPEDGALARMIPGGRFCRVGERIAGLIAVGKRTYVCVGKIGSRSSKELENPTVFFVPRSHFDKTEGYLLSFSLVDADEYIEKRFTER